MQKQRRGCSEMAGGGQSRQNQIPHPPGEWPTNWSTILPKKSSLCCEGSEPHARFPSLGSRQRDWVSPGNLILKASKSDYRTSTGLWETDFILGGHKQNLSHTKTQRKGTVTPQETEPKLPVSVGGPPWRRGSAHHRDRGTALGINPLGGHH